MSGSNLFASILRFVSNVRQLFAADDFSRRHFSDAFFLGALRVKSKFSVTRYVSTFRERDKAKYKPIQNCDFRCLVGALF